MLWNFYMSYYHKTLKSAKCYETSTRVITTKHLSQPNVMKLIHELLPQNT